jgi:ornithine cyclodeaminase/alanine dehydrogenase-like protein (mu-crystallin family)
MGSFYDKQIYRQFLVFKMVKNTIRIITAEEVKQALPMKKAIEIMKEAYVQITKNKAVIPTRIHLGIPESKGDALIMPIYMPDNERIGLKCITLFDNNPSIGLPLIHALVVVFDSTNGRPLALMDGSYLTALRTGAGSGAATDLLARKDSSVAAIFGAGVQGRTQLEAICSIRAIEKAIVFETDEKRAQAFQKEMSERLSIAIEIAKKPIELQQADIISTATSSHKPVFSDENLKSGAHINAIGSYKPHVRELPTETIKKAKVVVDHYESCLTEAGDILIPIQEGAINKEHIYAELGEIILQEKQSRTSNEDITIFKSVGNAIQDLMTANQILIAAEKLNLGTEISL